MKAYAKAENIKLLTHNDPKPFCTDSKLQDICCSFLGIPGACPLPGSVKWVARLPPFPPFPQPGARGRQSRYAVMIVSRSIMTAKGFVVDFGTCDKATGLP